MFGIVVDSSCDLKVLDSETSKKVFYARIPLKLDVGAQEFVDDNQLDVAEFLNTLYNYKGKTGSAAPSPQDWLCAFEHCQEVVAITITSRLSGSYGSASAAAKLFLEKYPERKIYIMDSRSTGPEMILLVRKLLALKMKGLPFQEIVTMAEEYRQKTHLLFVLQSMENLVKNGRVSKLQGALAGILGIKIVGIASQEGTLELLHKSRGKFTAYDLVVEEMLNRGFSGGNVVISHCENQAMVEYLQEKLQKQFSNCSVTSLPTGGLCSYYAERGGILVGFEAEVSR